MSAEFIIYALLLFVGSVIWTGVFTTADVPYPLSDGAYLLFTETTVRDRSGRDYKGAIIPDGQVQLSDAEQAASGWLKKNC